MTRPNRWIPALMVAFTLAMAAGAEPAKPTAAALYARAHAAYKARDFQEALAGYDTAAKAGAGLAASLGAARCLVQLGSWLAAEQRYRDVLRALSGGQAGDAGVQQEAALAVLRQTASGERAKLRADIPRLRLKITGAPPAEVAVTIGGNAIAASAFAPSATFPKGKALRLDPGEHRIVARHKKQTRSFAVRLHPGKLREASVRFVSQQTRVQRRCRDECLVACRGKGRNSPCYLACKQRCFRR